MKKNILRFKQFDSINIECEYSKESIESDNCSNDIIYIFYQAKINNKTIFLNNKFYFGNKNIKPQITLSYLKDNNKLNLRYNAFVNIFSKKKFMGYRFNSTNLINEVLNKKSLLYPHVFSYDKYNNFVNSNNFLFEEKVIKNKYKFVSKSKFNDLKKIFSDEFFNIGIGYTLQMNSFPRSLLTAINRLKKNIKLFIFYSVKVGHNYLTKEQAKILNKYDFVNLISINNKEKLNYLSLCDMLVSSCNDFTNVVGSSILIEEYLLCKKPILCSRGKERELQLGENYPGFYNCKTCYTVPPIYWCKSYLMDPLDYESLYIKYFKDHYDIEEINEIKDIINKEYLLWKRKQLERKELQAKKREFRELRQKRLEQQELELKKKCEEINSIYKIRNSRICIHTKSNLKFIAGDSIMLINFIKLFIENNNIVTVISNRNFNNIKNNISDSDNLIFINVEDVINHLNNNYLEYDFIILRNCDIINKLHINYLKKTLIYTIDSDLNNLKRLNNIFFKVITQSNKFKNILKQNGVKENKIIIQEPIVSKYNFDIPARNDNKIRLIYCGTLRDEENILEIIEDFKNIHNERPEVILTIVYGKIVGEKNFIYKINNIINQGIKGITFKYNLLNRGACYEIAISDMGICWRKPGWGDNGEISTKVKEYKMYGLEILHDRLDVKKLKHNISIICCTKRPSFHYNILESIKNLSNDNCNIKLLLCLNSKSLNVLYYQQYFDDNKIQNEIIKCYESLGNCLNKLVLKSDTKFIFKIDDDDIYLPGLIKNCISELYESSVVSTFKKYVYCPENSRLYLRNNNLGYGSFLGFNKDKVKKFIDNSFGEDTHFLKNNNVKLLDLSNYHIHIRHECTSYHSDKDKNYFNVMENKNLNVRFKNILNNHGLFEHGALLETNNNLIKKRIFKNFVYKKNIDIYKLNIIGILDEFLYNTLKNIFNIKMISCNEKITKNYSFFFCESCWNGNNGEWKYKINTIKIKKETVNILNQCKKLNIPTIFYNKEDPVNFDSYIDTAKHFDIIITTDINCVNKYKELTKSQIFVMPFTINPLDINNIGRKNDINNSFFAGSLTYSLSEIRKKNTNILLDKLKKKKFVLFDRNLNEKQRVEFYNSMYNINMFHPKYNKYLHEAIPHEVLLKVHKTTNWCGNLNTVKTSDTMFARRVIEASIMKNSVVTDYSQGVYKNFGNSIYTLEDELKYNTNEDILLNQIKKQIGWRTVIEKYNSYSHFSDLFKKININGFKNIFSLNEKISVICSTNRIDNYSIIIDNFNRQNYENKELIIVFNLNMNNEIENIINENPDLKIKQIDEKETLGHCLNEAIKLSTGEIISKFDDDDYYGKHYLTDMNYSMKISNADLVGKCAHMVYALETKELWVKFYKINYEDYTYQAKKWNFICGGSLFFKKYLFEKCKFKESNTGEDSYFIDQVKQNKFTIYASDYFNYCYIRNKQENHTFNTDFKTFIGTKSIMINKYDKIPINLIDI